MIQKLHAALLLVAELALGSCKKDIRHRFETNNHPDLSDSLSFHLMSTAAIGETNYSFAKLFDVAYTGGQQGLAFANGFHYVTFDVGSGQGRIIKYDSTGAEVKRSGRLDIGHAAEASYRQANERLYIANGGLNGDPTFVYEVDMQLATPVIERTIDFTNLGSNGMVAVDNSDGRLLVFTGPNNGPYTISVADFNGAVLEQFNIPTGLGLPQGIEVIGNEILYYTSFSSTPRHNQITVFSTTGTKLYAINVPVEIEGEGLSIDETTRTVYVGTHKPNQVYKMSPAFVSDALLGMNLLFNSNAEGGAGGTGASVSVSVPFWTTTGTTVVQYGMAGLPNASSPGSPNRRNNFFAGGRNAGGTMRQLINVSNLSTDIDAGTVSYSLKGWLGGYAAQNDNAKVTATFLNSNSTPLGTATIGPVLASDRNSVTGMVQRSGTGAVPVGTRSVSVTITMTRTSGSNCDGFADDLSLILTKF